MIKPVLQDDALVADVARTRVDKKNFYLWWLGQSGFLLQWQGKHLLFDPYLSDSLTKKYAASDKPHVRMTELAVTPDKLNFIDAVTSSHNHTDHFDPDTLRPLLKANPNMKVVVPEAIRIVSASRLFRKPDELIGSDAGLVKPVAGFRIQGIPAAHNDLEKDEYDQYKFLGYLIEFGPWRIYHAGDTIHYEGMENWIRPFKVDVALLPINGDRPERRVAGNLDGPQAAKLAKDVNARLVIPMHYEMFDFNTATPDEFVAACQRIGQPHCVVRCGERWSSADLPPK